MVEKDLKSRNWLELLSIYRQPRVLGMICLGFSAGLPFLLVFSTLSAWLRDIGIARTTIGFFSWVGITYSIKFFWAPVIDRLPFPGLTTWLGKRRGWLLAAQCTIVLGLAGMALTNPYTELTRLAIFALLVAFGSATQDICVDAYRIEAVEKNMQGAMAATYVFGYRIALLVTGAGAFYIAEAWSWPTAYLVMAALMGIGIATTLIISEPVHVIDENTRKLEEELEKSIGVQQKKNLPARIIAWFSDAVASPFVEFFQRNGALAIVILLLVSTYKISDITMGVMANPFYLDLGFSKTDIANVTKIFGFFMNAAPAAGRRGTDHDHQPAVRLAGRQ